MKDQLELVDNEVEAGMFELVIDKLTAAGFEHYEISNFTRGERSGHNMTYWKNDYYIGVGLGAHGHIKCTAEVEFNLGGANADITQVINSGNNSIRYENTRSITTYKKVLQAAELPVLRAQALTLEERIEESMFLGLRLMDGVDFNELSDRYHQDIFELYRERIDKLRQMGYVSLEAGMLRLTKKGLMMANDVFEEFLL
jgi:oxygen-independent coproporphyrinogen-3 oxidase